MTKTQLACAAALLMACATASAQVHQCKDAAGKTIFSDRPCESGQSGGLVLRKRSQEEILQERLEASEANNRKYRAQAEAQAEELSRQRRTAVQGQAQPGPTIPQAQTKACQDARKELDFVSSIRTLSQNELRMRTNAAISNVNAACGSNTPLMQEPPRVVTRPNHCVNTGGGMMHCF